MINVKGNTPAPATNVGNFTGQSAQAAPTYDSKANANTPMLDVPGEVNLKPNINAMTQTVASAAGGGATAITAYFMNEDVYNATPTNNGSGALSVTTTYGDGWDGGGYNRFAYLNSAANGIACYGITLVYTVIASAAQDASALATANPTWLMANLVGNRQVPVGLVLAAGVRNTQFQVGTMTVRFRFNMSALNQLSYSVPAADNATLTVITQPF